MSQLLSNVEKFVPTRPEVSALENLGCLDSSEVQQMVAIAKFFGYRIESVNPRTRVSVPVSFRDLKTSIRYTGDVLVALSPDRRGEDTLILGPGMAAFINFSSEENGFQVKLVTTIPVF